MASNTCVVIMANKVKVIILRTAGTNCDQETAHAFSHFGAQTDLIHINKLLSKEVSLEDYHILAIPGGFSYGDNIESGRILANELRFHLADQVSRFIADGKLIIGICNGFQVLVKSGILPGFNPGDRENISLKQKMTLTFNDSGKFEDRWTYLKVESKSVWTKNLDSIVYYPVAHAEGKFVASSEILQDLNKCGQVAFRYCTANGDKPDYPQNPNASCEDIAGITDSTGRILGLMPHPERYFHFTQHPFWTRLNSEGEYGQGAKIFENGICYVQKELLQQQEGLCR